MEEKTINPYIEKMLTDWFRNILTLIFSIPTIFLIIFAVVNKWIDQTFAIELIFLFVGIFVGKWFENGKK